MEKQMNITQKSTPNQSSRNGYKPCLIVWHIADGTYNGTVAWEQNPESQVSSHFVLGQNGEITQLVPLDKAAWTQGVVNQPTHPYVKAHSGVNPNLYCVSIECEGRWSETKGALTDKQLAAAAELTRYIEDFQTWVPADGASIGLECTSLHGIITLCVKNKVPRPGFAEALRAAFEAEGIKVLEAAELGADNT